MEQQDITSLKREYEKYRFKYLEQISDGIWLSWDKETGKLCRLRSISEEQAEVYQCLKGIINSHLPDILYIGTAFIAEEYISGTSLKDKTDNGKLTLKEVKDILKQLLPVIQQLHQNRIIHRDIKAPNIMSDGHGKYYLTDFDIAIKQGTNSETAGTAGYAPPEQYGYKDCDARSDIYSIGVLMNVLLTGHVPKEGLAKGRTGSIIKKCTMIDREDRYQNVEELYNAVFGSKKRIIKYILAAMLCIIPAFVILVWQTVDRKTGGIKDTGRTEEINSLSMEWVELEDYNISYPCLLGMELAGEDDARASGIQKIEQNMPVWGMIGENAFEKQFYYKTEDNAWLSISVVRDTDNQTGYNMLSGGLDIREDHLAYADASNTSFCYGEKYNDDNVLYYAGTVKNGIWLYMAMICPGDYENKYKQYLEAWRSMVKETGKTYLWQEEWAGYKAGKYVLVQKTDNITIEHCLEIQERTDDEIVFSITKISQQYGTSTIVTTGYVREYIIDDSVVFTGNFSSRNIEGVLKRGIDKNHIILNYDGKGMILKREE